MRTGEPVSASHSYTNYIKAAPDSLFRKQGLVEQYQKVLPNYPGQIYDYYRINRFVTVGVGGFDTKAWNKGLSELNARVGAPKQANVIVVLTNQQSDKYYHALRQHWLGGKKNDIVVVLGVEDRKINWAHIMSWSKSDLFNIKLRDALLELGEVEREKVLALTEANVVKHFQRKPMSDFEYLESSITPTTGQLFWAMLINLLISVGLGLYMYHNDFEEGGRRSLRRRW